MLEVLVVRHGESLADVEKRFEGRADFELTPLGVAQAERVAAWIHAEYPPQVLISSPLKRAARTAQIIGAAVGLDPRYDDGLLEWNNGQLAGRPKSESDQFPKTKDGPHPYEEPYETESAIAFRARAHAFWLRLVDDYYQEDGDRRVCLVSHGGIINMLFRSFLDLPLNTDIGIRTSGTGVHLWRMNEKGRSIVFSNSQIHLVQRELTVS